MAEALRGVDGNLYEVGTAKAITGDWLCTFIELGSPIPLPTNIEMEAKNKVTKFKDYTLIFEPTDPYYDILILGDNRYLSIITMHFDFSDGTTPYYSHSLWINHFNTSGERVNEGGYLSFSDSLSCIKHSTLFCCQYELASETRLACFVDWYYYTSGSSTNIRPSFWELETGLGLENQRYQVSYISIVDADFSNEVPTSSKGGTGATIVGDLFQIVSDTVDPPSLPNISAVGCGMVTLYAPTLAQINALSDVLWSSDTDFFENLSKLWTNPLECIVGIGIFPMQPPTGTVSTVKLGTLNTGVNMSKLSNQYTSFNCGSVKVKQFFGNALDYSPYTKVSLYLPFHGVELLNVDEVMGATVNVTYNIDFLSGGFVAVVTIKKDNLDAVLYHFSGNMMTPIPITSNNYMGLYQSLMQGASGLTQFATGNVMGGVSTMASAVMSKKMTVSRSGSLSGNTGILDNMKPYFIIERPMQSLASNYNKFEGFPSNITAKLSTLKGYTSVESLKSNTLTCPQVEQDEIIALLKGGVFL